jgi:murein DD-endopeptidase MepM/ murein hydrolase activator NlpD
MPSSVTPPSFKFPWDTADSPWYYTGGLHGYDDRNSCVEYPISDPGNSYALSGIDVAKAPGREVLAMASGTVIQAGWRSNAWGYTIEIDHSINCSLCGYQTMYAHLAEDPTINPGITVGTQVVSGTPIGIVGGTGNVPPHLHIELKLGGNPVTWDGVAVDGWRIRAIRKESDQSIGFNYEGTTTLGPEAQQSRLWCEKGAAVTTGVNGTKYADVVMGLANQLYSTNAPVCPFGTVAQFGSNGNLIGCQDGSSCPAPTLIDPANGGNIGSHTITFSWNPVSGCTFNGYTFRVCISPDIDNLSNCFIDTGEANTQRTESINSSFDNQDLYWGVKAANALNAAWSPARRFRIVPDLGNTCPQSGGVILYKHANYDCGGQGVDQGYIQQMSPGDYNLNTLSINDEASSMRILAGWSVGLYRDAGLNGPVACLNGDDNDFGNNTYDNSTGLNDSVSSFRVYTSPNCNGEVSGTVNLCRNNGYSNCMPFTNDAPSLGNAGFGNDDAESIKMQGEWSAVLFADDNYHGTHSVFNGDDSNLGDNPIGNNQASSMRIRKRSPAYFTLYERGDWNGEAFSSDRTITDLGHWDKNDWAKSIRVTSGYEVVVCGDSDFHGVCGRTNQDQGDLNSVAQGLRQAASSVRVCSGSCPDPPDKPQLNKPVDNTILVEGNPVIFQWSGNGDKYLVEIQGGGLSSPQKSDWINSTQLSKSGLSVSTEPYQWRVKSWNGFGESDWSSWQSFNLVETSPSEVFLDFSTTVSNTTAVEIVVTKAGKFQDSADFLFSQVVTTNSQGDYIGLPLTDIVPGRYDLYAKPEGYLRKVAEVQLVAGTNRIDFDTFVVGDLNGDNVINVMELLTILSHWGSSDPDADVNGDGIVGIADLVLVLGNWGQGAGWTDDGPLGTPFAATVNAEHSLSLQQGNGTIMLSPETGVFNVGDTFDMQVLLDTADQVVDGVDVIIHYDPGVLEVQDAVPGTNGIQINPGSIYPSVHNNEVNPALGEISFSVEGTLFQGNGTLATINFKVMTSISNTAVDIYHQDGWTGESNAVEDSTLQDILGQTNTASLQTVGSPNRPLPTVSFITPSEDEIINSSAIQLEVEATDPYSQIQKVNFEANLNNVWSLIGSDSYSPNGWDFYWDVSSIPDGNVELRAIASLLGGEGTTVTRNVMLDRTPPTYISSTFTPNSIVSAGDVITVEVTTADDNSGVDHVDVYAKFSGSENKNWSFLGPIVGDQGSFVWNTSNYSAGTYQIAYSIQDRAGNWGPDPQPQLFIEIEPSGTEGDEAIFLPVLLKE